MSSHPYPRQALPRYSILNTPYSRCITSGQPSLWASGPLASNRTPRINQFLPFELLKGEAGESAVIDKEHDDGGASQCVGERDEFRPALQRLRQSGHVRLDGEDLQAGIREVCGDFDGGRFAQVVYVRLEGEPEAGDDGVLARGGADLRDDVMRLGVVDLPGGADETRFRRPHP